MEPPNKHPDQNKENDQNLKSTPETGDSAYDQAEELFLETEEDIPDEVVNEVLGGVFKEVYGVYGHEEFFGIAVPQIKAIYGERRMKASIRLLDLIKKGRNQPREIIGKFFESAVSEKEKQFNKRPKEEVLKEVTDKIKEGILEHNSNNKTGTTIVGVVLYGSYARGDFHYFSDLDVSYIIQSSEPENNKNLNKTLSQDLRKRIQARLKIHIDETITSYHRLDDIEDIKWLHNETMILVTPYPEVEAKIQSAK